MEMKKSTHTDHLSHQPPQKQVLQRLTPLLEPHSPSSSPSSSSSLVLTEKGEAAPLPRHPDFRLFAAMNPATDAGKKDLPPALRARFTEVGGWVVRVGCEEGGAWEQRVYYTQNIHPLPLNPKTPPPHPQPRPLQQVVVAELTDSNPNTTKNKYTLPSQLKHHIQTHH